MPITHEGKYERSDMWKEGEWLDLWSVVHFLSGMSIGFVFYLLHLGAIASVVIVLLALTSYEMWEKIVGIEETPINRAMDVVVGMVSFLPVFFFLAPILSQPLFISTFGAVLTANVVLSIFGWRASQKAAALKARAHARYLRERARFLERAMRLRSRFRQK